MSLFTLSTFVCVLDSFIHPIVDGLVVIFSLRNPAYPEQVWTAPKGAMGVDVHPGYFADFLLLCSYIAGLV